MTHIVFFSRLFLYLLAVSVPMVHPAVLVSYDTFSVLVWFGLVPLEMAIAWFAAPPRLRLRNWIALGIAPLVVAGFAMGVHTSPWLPVGAGALAFSLTALLFYSRSRCRAVYVIEQVGLAALFLRLLNFSRASEIIAQQSAHTTQVLFGLLIIAFLLHGAVITFFLGAPTNASGDHSRYRFEAIIFAVVCIVSLFALGRLLPQDFLAHNPVVNLLGRTPEPEATSLDHRARELLEQSERQSESGTAGTGAGDGQTGDGEDFELAGIPSENWGSGNGGTDEQRAVMVVASLFQPVYAADEYLDDFHTTRGFRSGTSQPLNDLVRERLAGTWQNSSIPPDRGRSSVEVAFYSTRSSRVLPYLPVSVEPTVFQPRYHPFSYSYRGVSRVQNSTPIVLRRARSLSAAEQSDFRPWIDIDLEPEHRAAFEEHLARHIPDVPDNLYDRIDAIKRSFRTFQYELGFEDDFSTANMARFVSETQSGDCVEFSNTAAILGRMMGIPSRVVTGYLAAESLQTPAHDRGLAVLRDSLPALQEYGLHELLLVTTSHRHAWVQFWIPGFGWTDFEPTQYAIPPEPGQDPNERRVVIPIIDPRDPAPETVIPWNEVFRIVAWVIATGILLLYLWRYCTEVYLLLRARAGGRRGIRAQYRLLLMRLAADGYALKPRSDTVLEYARTLAGIHAFAHSYVSAMYGRQGPDSPEMQQRVRTDFRNAVRALKRRGAFPFFRRVLSLRGLHYA